MFNLIPWNDNQETSTRSLLADTAEGRLASLRDDFDGLFHRFFGSPPTIDERWFEGPLGWSFEVDDSEQQFTIRAEAPGFEAGDFDVQVRGNYLTIVAEHQEEAKHNRKGHSYSQFYRTTKLPRGANPEEITARYHSGVLELTLPKFPEAIGKRITIQSS